MIARGFKPVAWVAAVGAAALGCYMLSLQVAAERADLAGLERRIVSTQQHIRALHTELGTRGRVQQLQAWNDEVLALVAPVSGQYLAGGVTLARFDTRQPVLADQAEVRMASAEVPATAAPAAPIAVPRRAVAAAPAPAPLQQPSMIHRASVTVAAAPAPAPVRARPEAVRPAAAAAGPPAQPARPAVQRARVASAEPARARPAARQAALLDDRTLRDLGSASRVERGGGTNN